MSKLSAVEVVIISSFSVEPQSYSLWTK